MIDYISGTLKSKSNDCLIIEAAGLGYKMYAPASTLQKLPSDESPLKVYIVEAPAGMYGATVNLYGFSTKEERDMFLLIKEEVPATGAKKALEYLDKISKSFADFKAAVLSKDSAMIHSIFGFTKKTADKLINALKEKIESIAISGSQKWTDDKETTTPTVSEAVMALISLGIKEAQARQAVKKAFENDENLALEDLIKKSLKHIR